MKFISMPISENTIQQQNKCYGEYYKYYGQALSIFTCLNNNPRNVFSIAEELKILYKKIYYS